MKRRIVLPAIALGLVAAAGAVAVAVPSLPVRRDTVPTTRATKGPLKLTVHGIGDLRAGRTVTLVTPPVGGQLRIVTLAPTGTPVKSGDPVVEFDPADQQYALEQAKDEGGCGGAGGAGRGRAADREIRRAPHRARRRRQ
jgi:multidrug efflux pump subunit AcrA (membrane-fusion protein)